MCMYMWCSLKSGSCEPRVSSLSCQCPNSELWLYTRICLITSSVSLFSAKTGFIEASFEVHAHFSVGYFLRALSHLYQPLLPSVLTRSHFMLCWLVSGNCWRRYELPRCVCMCVRAYSMCVRVCVCRYVRVHVSVLDARLR